MELIVHGTKQGYKSNFIPNVQPIFALGDIRNGVNNENPLGQSIYSLAFIRGGYIFTKYTIIRDTLRAYATGNIAFSLHLSSNRELEGKGASVKSLLDNLSKYYIDNYTRENNINRGETGLIQEDWGFVKEIMSGVKELEKSKVPVYSESKVAVKSVWKPKKPTISVTSSFSSAEGSYFAENKAKYNSFSKDPLIVGLEFYNMYKK